MRFSPFIKTRTFLNDASSCCQLLLRIGASCCQLLLACVRHKMHFLSFSYWQHVFTPRARKQHLAATRIAGALA